MIHLHHQRAERLVDPSGEHGKVAGPAAVVGHHDKAACQLIGEGHPASLRATTEFRGSPLRLMVRGSQLRISSAI